MKETEKYDSKLYNPNKPYHKMSIHELIDHCKICKSLDKMPYNKIKKIENLSDYVLQKKIKHFLERNNENTIRKNTQKNKQKNKQNTQKNTQKNKQKNKQKNTQKNTQKNNNKLTKKHYEKIRKHKTKKTKKTNI